MFDREFVGKKLSKAISMVDEGLSFLDEKDNAGPSPPPYVSLKITVTGYDEGLQGAIVKYKSTEYMTDSEGKTHFTVPVTEDCVLDVSASSYQSKRVTIPKEDFVGEVYELHIQLEKKNTTTLNLTVLNMDNNPLNHARVLYDSAEYYTGADGKVSVDLTRNHDAVLDVSCDGYDSERFTITVDDMFDTESIDRLVKLPKRPNNLLLTVNVKDSNSHNGVPSKVMYNNTEYVTDDNGVVSLNVHNDYDCVLNINASHYKTITHTVTVQEMSGKEEYSITVYIEESRVSLDLTVLDNTTGLNNVKVNYNNTDYYTNDNGLVNISLYGDEEAILNLSHEGYVSQELTIPLSELEGQTHIIRNIQLAKIVGTAKITVQDIYNKPLKGLTIRVDGINKGVTDTNGVATIDNIPIGKHTFEVAGGTYYNDQTLPNQSITEGETPLTIMLTGKTLNRVFRCIDKTTGNPIEGVTVEVDGSPTKYTDNNGEVEYTMTFSEKTNIRFIKEGYTDLFIDNYYFDSTEPYIVEMILITNGTLEIYITNSDTGSAIMDVEFRLDDPEGEIIAHSNWRGEATIYDVPYGEHTLYPDSRGRFRDTPKVVNINSTFQHVDVSLDPIYAGQTVVSVSTTGSEEGGVRVDLDNITRYTAQGTGDAIFEDRLFFIGTHHLKIFKDGYKPINEFIELTEDPKHLMYILESTEYVGNIYLHITDEITGQGVDNAIITIKYGQNLSQEWIANTDEWGEAHVEAPHGITRGPAEIEIIHPQYERLNVQQILITDDMNLYYTLAPDYGNIVTFNVRDAYRGLPVQNVSVEVSNVDGDWFYREGTTDAEGKCSMNLPARSMSVYYRPMDGYNAGDGVVDIHDGDEYTVELVPWASEVSFDVWDYDDNKLAGAKITYNDVTVTTDSNGHADLGWINWHDVEYFVVSARNHLEETVWFNPSDRYAQYDVHLVEADFKDLIFDVYYQDVDQGRLHVPAGTVTIDGDESHVYHFIDGHVVINRVHFGDHEFLFKADGFLDNNAEITVDFYSDSQYDILLDEVPDYIDTVGFVVRDTVHDTLLTSYNSNCKVTVNGVWKTHTNPEGVAEFDNTIPVGMWHVVVTNHGLTVYDNSLRFEKDTNIVNIDLSNLINFNVLVKNSQDEAVNDAQVTLTRHNNESRRAYTPTNPSEGNDGVAVFNYVPCDVNVETGEHKYKILDAYKSGCEGMTMTDVVINDGDTVNMTIRCNQTI